MQPGHEGGQPPLPPYGASDAGSSSTGWHHEQQPVMPPLPGSSAQALPEGWQHAGWATPEQAWSFAQQGQWGPQAHIAQGGYAIAGQMGAQHVQYYAVAPQQGGMPQGGMPQHQGGVIFLCDPRTEEECLQRGLFGLPATQTQIVRAIVPEATLLFLFNVRSTPRRTARSLLRVARSASAAAAREGAPPCAMCHRPAARAVAHSRLPCHAQRADVSCSFV